MEHVDTDPQEHMEHIDTYPQEHMEHIDTDPQEHREQIDTDPQEQILEGTLGQIQYDVATNPGEILGQI